MRRKSQNRISRIRSRGCTARSLSEFERRGHAVLFIHRLQRGCAPGLCLRGSHCLCGSARLPPNGTSRGTGDRILPAWKRAGVGRLPDRVLAEFRKTACDGRAKFCHGAAHDHAKCRPEVFEAFRAPAKGADFEACFTGTAFAALDSLEIVAASPDDPEFFELGAPLGHAARAREQP